MTTITNKKQYPSEQYLNELITNIEFAARAPVEVVKAMAESYRSGAKLIVPNLQVIMKSCHLIISKVKKMVLNGLRSLQKQITHKLATGFTMTRWSWLKLSEKVLTCPNSMDQLR